MWFKKLTAASIESKYLMIRMRVTIPMVWVCILPICTLTHLIMQIKCLNWSKYYRQLQIQIVTQNKLGLNSDAKFDQKSRLRLRSKHRFDSAFTGLLSFYRPKRLRLFHVWNTYFMKTNADSFVDLIIRHLTIKLSSDDKSFWH